MRSTDCGATAERILKRLRIDRDSTAHPFHQIAAGIQQQIDAGDLEAGDRLPTCRQISAGLGVSATTANRALSELAQRGLVVSRTRAGTVVAECTTPSLELLVPFDRDEAVTRHEFIRVMLNEADRQFGRQKRRACLTYVDRSMTTAAEILAVSRIKRVDGLLVYRPYGDIATELVEVAAAMPLVSMFYPVPDSAADAVIVDPTEGLRALLRRRFERGARSFAYVGMEEPPTDGRAHSPDAAMRRAFMAFVQEAGIEPALSTWFAPREWENEDIFRRLAALPDDAVLVGFSSGWVGWVQDRIGRTFDGIGYTEFNRTLRQERHRVSTLFADAALCVRKGVQLLRRRIIEGLEAPPLTEVIKPKVFDVTSQEGGDDYGT